MKVLVIPAGPPGGGEPAQWRNVVRDNWLADMQALVGGGHIEFAHMHPEDHAAHLELWCNEDGITRSLPPNMVITDWLGPSLYHLSDFYGPRWVARGDFVLAKTHYEDLEPEDVPRLLRTVLEEAGKWPA